MLIITILIGKIVNSFNTVSSWSVVSFSWSRVPSNWSPAPGVYYPPFWAIFKHRQGGRGSGGGGVTHTGKKDIAGVVSSSE
jgi:hypothetical protein